MFGQIKLEPVQFFHPASQIFSIAQQQQASLSENEISPEFVENKNLNVNVIILLCLFL